MEVTRDVILDLLPLYLAHEVSADTRALVESYLLIDPELAKIADQSAAIALPEDIPIPITKENEMEAYKEAQRSLLLRTVIIAALISFALLAVMAFVVLAFFLLSSG
jgi:hypothetical protein